MNVEPSGLRVAKLNVRSAGCCGGRFASGKERPKKMFTPGVGSPRA